VTSGNPYRPDLEFEWDDAKSRSNFEKNGIDFDEAIGVFYGSHLLRRSDRGSEERWLAIGETEGRVITIVFAYRNNKLRIVSARRARKNEERDYRYGTMGRST
jgi:uncharacterized DUF497 family protein